MGIPSYFKHVISKYRSILTEYQKNTIHIDNLYIDAQSLIYDAVRSDLVKKSSQQNVEQIIINEVAVRISMYINSISPSKKVFIAFDGVAPVAKMQQQKTRRYKGHIEKNLYSELGCPQEESWNTVALTPGTAFMKSLNINIEAAFSNHRKYKVQEIIISGSDKAGEGEHKIFEYIRSNPDYHKTSITAVYGLDADLIMLSLNHLRIADNIYLFRETPHFIQSIDSSLSADKNYMINIPEMAKAITIDLNDGEDIINESQKQRMFDYIFICFFLGNDFLPHFPTLNIRTDGISRITAAYKETLAKAGNLTSKDGIIWKNIRLFVTILALNEEKYFQEEHKIRDKQAKSVARGRPGDDFIVSSVLNLPLLDRVKEEYINPYEDGWKERYYRTLFDSEKSDFVCQSVSLNYIEGLEWSFRYYTNGCPDWTWKYKYNYPPLLCDLKNYIPYFDQTFITKENTKPIHPNVQLAYVLPLKYLNLLPEKIFNKLITDKPEWYDEKMTSIEYSYCRYFWESHIKSPYIEIIELENIVMSV